jgi:hypothetical protein
VFSEKNESFQTITNKMIDKPANIRQDVFNRKLILPLQLGAAFSISRRHEGLPATLFRRTLMLSERFCHA